MKMQFVWRSVTTNQREEKNATKWKITIWPPVLTEDQRQKNRKIETEKQEQRQRKGAAVLSVHALKILYSYTMPETLYMKSN